MQEKNLEIQLEQEMHDAMKQHHEVLLSTLRMLRSAISNRKIEKRGKMAKAGDDAPAELSNEEVLEVIRSEAKRRRDAVSEFTKAARTDLAEKEETELKILERHLPAELSDEEIEKLVQPLAAGRAIDDFGRVMGAAMKAVAGRASGDRVGAIVRKILMPKE